MPQVRRWLKLTPLIGFRPRACLSCPRSQSSSVGVWLQNPCMPFTHQFASVAWAKLPKPKEAARCAPREQPARGHEGVAREGHGGERVRDGGVCQDAAMFSAPGFVETADVMASRVRYELRRGIATVVCWWPGAAQHQQTSEGKGLAFEFRAAIPQSPEIRIRSSPWPRQSWKRATVEMHGQAKKVGVVVWSESESVHCRSRSSSLDGSRSRTGRVPLAFLGKRSRVSVQPEGECEGDGHDTTVGRRWSDLKGINREVR